MSLEAFELEHERYCAVYPAAPSIDLLNKIASVLRDHESRLERCEHPIRVLTVPAAESSPAPSNHRARSVFACVVFDLIVHTVGKPPLHSRIAHVAQKSLGMIRGERLEMLTTGAATVDNELRDIARRHLGVELCFIDDGGGSC